MSGIAVGVDFGTSNTTVASGLGRIAGRQHPGLRPAGAAPHHENPASRRIARLAPEARANA